MDWIREFNEFGPQRGSGDQEWQDTAQICLNGHVINDYSKGSPELNQKFCDRCGAATITQCPSCKNGIPGNWHIPNVGHLPYELPAFCKDCGTGYPWKEAKRQAAVDLIKELEGLDDDERKALTGTLDDLIKESPQTTVAATRFQRLASKLSKEGKTMLRDLVVDIASEAAKKILLGS